MSSSDLELVDSHIHWWDPANPWMQMAAPDLADELGMGDVSGMKRPFLPETYRRETAGYRVSKVVWVMATMDASGHVAETTWAHGLPGASELLGAMIGSVDPALGAAERRAALDAQTRLPQFRGVRVLGGLVPGRSSDEYLRMLADRGLVYDDMCHHETMADSARLAERHPDVPWILEHCGWPLRPDDPSYVAAWRAGIEALAAVETVHCKLSGVAMATHSFDTEAQRPFLEHCLEAFGPDRCMFGSNFPVDALYGTFGELVDLVDGLTQDLSDTDRRGVLRANAEHVYTM